MNRPLRFAVSGLAIAAVSAGAWALWRRPAEGSIATASAPAQSSPTDATSTASSTTAPSATALATLAPPTKPAEFERKVRPGEHAFEFVAPVYSIDKIYRSMTGPMSSTNIALLEPKAARQLIWITGLQATMVSAEGKLAMPPEFMCHVNVDVDATKHDEAYGHHLPMSGRLFTLSQGQLDVAMPKGFGIPIWSDLPIGLTTQVLNLNHRGAPFEVRHDVQMTFVTDADAKKSKTKMKPLFMAGVYGLALIKGDHGYFGEDKPSGHGSGCMMGKAASGGNYTDAQGKEFSGHWIVKPGHEVNHTPVTKMLDLPFDTTIHHIAVHLHPFATSLTLVDLTTGKTVYEAKTKQLDGKIGLDHVDSFDSEEGIPVFKDHEYELVSVYDNTTSVDQDSMAVMLLYLLDKEFTREPMKKPSTRTSAPSTPTKPGKY